MCPPSLNRIKPQPNEYNISENIIQQLLHIVACCLIVFNRGVAKRMQHFVQHDTFLKKIFTTEYNKVAWGGQTSTTSHNIPENKRKVAWGGQTSTTSHNIPENKRNVASYNNCLVTKFDRTKPHKTMYNTIQNDTKRWPNECNISYNIKVV